MNEVYGSLLAHLAQTLFGVPTEAKVTDEVLREARRHTVLSLMPITESQVFWKIISQNTRRRAEHRKVHDLMTRLGIPYAILKGITSARYYPEPVRRQLGDVDLIVKPADFERAVELLEKDGHHGVRKMQEHHVRYDEGPAGWELHWRAPGFPENHEIERYVDEMVDNAREYEGCMCLSDFHHGLILLTHSAYHWINAGFNLRAVCDWAVFYSHFPEDEFIGMFEETLRRLGLWKYAQYLTALCIRYLKAPERAFVGEQDEAFLEALMEDILIPDSERINQAKLLMDEGSMTVDGTGMVRRFFIILSRKACLVWPACEKYRILLPFGMIAHLVKYAVKVVKGKKPKVHLGQMVTGAKKRKSLYQRFELFR